MARKTLKQLGNDLEHAQKVIASQRDTIQELRNPKDTCAMEPAPQIATPGGPNRPDAIYPPGCGPMQLVWAHTSDGYGGVVLGFQCDSFRTFPSKNDAADWLRDIARSIETSGR